jgi:hypothetical protein
MYLLSLIHRPHIYQQRAACGYHSIHSSSYDSDPEACASKWVGLPSSSPCRRLSHDHDSIRDNY